ncbi:sirohydrochlorin chelatase [Amycolatopsis sp. CA-230715]|uniref:sirohydrochlorin chelatase n=1 Tax=Amycolatopsis sp. CA-230715 TaxID=2745196 RepID=UPI001C038413|nr:CbiX/SirB N-terminal domain-containing protein [Amycolatopsis sp. CA-230715]QWF76715.1 Sirohydrochlorin ferrochelatase [Amycolatopsis sp. CA-230715]
MIVLAAHGTRDPAGAVVVAELAGLVRSRGVPVRVAYADVREPDVTTVLDSLGGRPAVVVPAFLAAGYHVRADIPAQVAASGHPAVTVAAPLGPAAELLDVACLRLRAAGYRQGDTVLLAAAGSSDDRALADVRRAARAMAARLETPVRIGYAATASPTVAEVAEVAREAGGRVAVASWLLAPGLFQRRVQDSGADVVADPLGAHPRVADLVLRRYFTALADAA